MAERTEQTEQIERAKRTERTGPESIHASPPHKIKIEIKNIQVRL